MVCVDVSMHANPVCLTWLITDHIETDQANRARLQDKWTVILWHMSVLYRSAGLQPVHTVIFILFYFILQCKFKLIKMWLLRCDPTSLEPQHGILAAKLRDVNGVE